MRERSCRGDDDANVGFADLLREEVCLTRTDERHLDFVPELCLHFRLEDNDRRDDVRAVDSHDKRDLALSGGVSIRSQRPPTN